MIHTLIAFGCFKRAHIMPEFAKKDKIDAFTRVSQFEELLSKTSAATNQGGSGNRAYREVLAACFGMIYSNCGTAIFA
jgi:hypothetical protein